MPDRNRLPQTPKASEDRFEILRASKTLFQRRLTEIIAHCGMRAASALAAFGREIGEAHDQLAAASIADEDADQDVDFTASRLTLMADDDLELDIRIRGIAIRLREAGGRNLWRSQLRYMTLLSRPAMSAASNPVGPEAICLGLWAICRHGGGGIEQTLSLLDRLEQGLRQQLPGFYGEIDALLAGYGVAPANHLPVTPKVRPGLADAGAGQPPANPLSTLQQMVSQQFGADQLASPLQFTGHSGAKSGNPAVDAAAMIMLNHLFDRLTALEARPTGGAGGAATEALPHAPLGALKAKDLDLPLGKTEAVTLDTLALIFEAIFDTAEVPDAIKALIGRLQIPLLKLAIVDSSLLANDRHPARLLINRMARAALGLPHNVGSAHPVCRQVGRLTIAARATLEKNGALLDPHLAELETLINERDQAIQRVAETYLPLLLEHENRQSATQLAADWLRVSLAKTRSPEIASFLEKYWLPVMVAAAAAGGVQGKRWQEDSGTADELIWSVLPKQTSEDRKRLASLASSLLARIRAGLDAIGVAAAEKKPFLDTLFDLQTAALRSQVLPATAQPGVAAADNRQAERSASTPPAEAACLLERDGQQVLCLPVPAGTRSPERGTTDECRMGDWLRFSVSPQESRCGLCCSQSAAPRAILLFNPEWRQAVAMPRATLDQQMRSGLAQIVSRIGVFDAAAARALKRLEQR